ncbi:dNA replication and repair protein RecN [Clostridium sp. CAG:356]|nr:dNA replication and repair protein RecN [Clostridium sp. CAG:356]
MITNLHIKNIGIIDDLEIDLNKGMNVLTGETGAGKTLIIDSISIICGGRFSKEMIRKGENHSYVELCMYVPNDVNSIDGNIIITREIYNNGRNMCKINGRLVTVAELKNFMSNYIEIHGQNDNQKLLDSRTHIKYLDNFSGEGIIQLKNEYKEKYQRYNEIRRELKNNYGDEKEKQRKLDLLRYQLNEIQEARLKDGEESELEERSKLIRNSEKIAKNLSEAEMAVGENTIDLIGNAIRALEKIGNIDRKYEETTTSLKNIYYGIQEISSNLSGYLSDIEFDEQEREEVETRLDIIDNLKRKYGNNIEEILKYADEIDDEIKKIENVDEYNNKLKNEQKQIEKEMTKIAEKISKIRKENAEELNKKINKELEDLEMKNAKINVKVEYKIEQFFEDGKDQVGIYIKTNVGENESELTKIASGGEMSRIMLAIKKVLAEVDNMPVMIFDEIDTGISGKAAKSVANKMRSISKNHQVLCISHLAPIAAMADYNYFISKKVENDRTCTSIKLLNEQEVLCEIARISSGEINDVTLQYANELRSKIA